MPGLYLIDGHAYIHRAYHALPPLTTSKGQPVNAVYGFVRMLHKIIKQEKPDHLVVCFDTAAPTFRHVAYAEYKATRKEIDDALVSQFPLVHEAVKAMNVAACELDGYEADDVIAHLTQEGRKKGWDVVVVSADKDILQLVNDHVKVLSEPKNVLYDTAKVQERYGLPPERLPDYFALIGDTSDNVKGVPGIGPKTAVKLLQEFGTLDNLLKEAPGIKGKIGPLLQVNADAARESRSLVTLQADVPLKIDWVEATLKAPVVDQLAPFLQRMEFHSMLDEILPQSSASAAVSAGSSSSTPVDYAALETPETLEEWVRQARAEAQVALDLVTDVTDPVRARLLGFSLAFKSGMARYIPLNSMGLIASKVLPIEDVRKHLKEILRGQSPRIYGHNLKFIQLVLKRHGLEIGHMHCDTMVASYVLNPSRASHALKDLVIENFGDRMIGIEQLVGKGTHQIRMEHVALEKLVPYACANADMVWRAAQVLEGQIKEKHLDKLFYDMEMPLVNVLVRMEEAGIRIDRPYLADLGTTLQKRIGDLEKKIYEMAGEPFNLNSPKQLSTILFEKLKLPVVRRTKTGFSTDEEVLQTLSASHPMPASLIEFRELQKMQSTYVDGLQSGLLPSEDRIHSNFNQTVAATGRLSSSSPNLQNIPIRTELGRQIRKAFVPEAEHVFLSADYSQIDLRVLAHISKDKTLMRAFQEGEDVHLLTAGEVFGVPAKEVTSDMRRAAKSINFGIVYGMSAFGLSQQLQITPEEARKYIERYFERYPGVKRWLDQILEEARRDGYVKTLFGRIRYLPEIKSKNTAVRGFAERTAMNTPIQGTSADIIKLAMLHVETAQAKKEWSGRMLIQVHDELLFEIHPNDLAVSAPKIKSLMEKALPLSIPIVVDLKSGSNWSEMAPFKYGL